MRLSILSRDKGICYLCGLKATQVDHVIPRVDGGPTKPWNLKAICGPCNAEKSKSEKRFPGRNTF